MEYTDELINSLLDNKKIISTELDYIILELKKSLISDWKLEKIVQQSNVKVSPKSNLKQNPLNNNYIEFISTGIQMSNILNEYIPDLIYDDDFYNILNELHDTGIIFDTKFNSDYVIEIGSREIVFPVCCVGKNRSQYLFYYLKYLESQNPNHFVVGYPSSGDELSVITDYLKSNQMLNQILNHNILTSYSTQYKKDIISSSISKSFGIINPDKLSDIPRSIHIFDKIFKQKDLYNDRDLKNFEPYKYNINKYDIFDKTNNQIYEKIIKLYIKYFLTPENLLEITNFNIPYKMKKITYICMSDKSFYNLTKCFCSIKNVYPKIKLNNVRIVYFGTPDIFQRSNIKDYVLNDYKEKIFYSIKFIYDKDIVMIPN
jgi:hypothetical protein